MNHSVVGGTGSGLGVLIMETIAVDYSIKIEMDFAIHLFNDNQFFFFFQMIMQKGYNALLSTYSS